MNFRVIIIISSCFLYIFHVNCEIITMGVIGGIASLASYTLYKFGPLKLSNYCGKHDVNFNQFDLSFKLHKDLYGQNIVHDIVINALNGHFELEEPKKALVMSFHGPPGTGKNFVSKIIANTIFPDGEESKYYHFYNGRIEFPLESKISEYEDRLINEVINALKLCPRSMFVFDEVDKMPPGVLNALVPFLDHSSGKLYANKAIFIFLSNTGSRQIVDLAIDLWKQGYTRKNYRIQDFEILISLGAFNENGGFKFSDTIYHHVIDHYVPFLPLEKKHVIKCIEAAFKYRGFRVTRELENEVLNHVTFGPEPYDLYSNAGCKRIEQKVAYVVSKTKRKNMGK